MDLWRIAVSATSEAADAVGEALSDVGLTALAVEDAADLAALAARPAWGMWVDPASLDTPPEGARVTAYLPRSPGETAAAPRLAALLRALRERLRAVRDSGLDAGSLGIEVTGVDADSYLHAWKRHYRELNISERLAVVPSWEAEGWRGRPGQIPLWIDPGVAFGTGVHETTVLCLRALEEWAPGRAVLDVGTGTGILAVAAAKLGAARVLALDLDPLAVAVARANVERNGAADRVQVRESDLLAAVGADDRFDVIAANLLAGIVLRLLPDAWRALAPGGRLLASGIVRAQADGVAAAMREQGLAVQARALGDWVLLAGRR